MWIFFAYIVFFKIYRVSIKCVQCTPWLNLTYAQFVQFCPDLHWLHQHLELLLSENVINTCNIVTVYTYWTLSSNCSSARLSVSYQQQSWHFVNFHCLCQSNFYMFCKLSIIHNWINNFSRLLSFRDLRRGIGYCVIQNISSVKIIHNTCIKICSNLLIIDFVILYLLSMIQLKSWDCTKCRQFFHMRKSFRWQCLEYVVKKDAWNYVIMKYNCARNSKYYWNHESDLF